MKQENTELHKQLSALGKALDKAVKLFGAFRLAKAISWTKGGIKNEQTKI